MKHRFLVLALLLGMLLSYQACNKPVTFNGEQNGFKSEGNGEGYSGKPTPYNFRVANQPCSEAGANGKPLPNKQVFLFPNGLALLVREACTDITPRPLSAQEFSFATNGDLIYQGESFVGNFTQGTFDVLAASCPSGRTLLANPARTSILVDSLNLLSNSWYNHGGYSLSLQGSLASLPLFKMERDDPNALDNWRRIAQRPLVEANETYSYSFFVKPDPSQKIRFIAYQPSVQDLQIDFELVNGASTLIMSQGSQFLSSSVKALSGGLYITVYFKSLVATQTNIGIGPAGQSLGDSISITALQMEKVSDYCAP